MKNIKITCSDGFELSGNLYVSENIKAAIMIAPATGIKKEFYNSFAQYLKEKEYGVLTFDNRGIAQSVGENLNKVNASLINWGKLDMTAALEELKNQFTNTEYHLVGHSAGGQLIGLMDNYSDIKSIFNFASSSGSLQYARYPFKFKSFFFLRMFIPFSNLLFGHTKSEWFGMGESLPKEVASQWSRWCSGKGYSKVDFGKEIKEHNYNEMQMPSFWVHATDDEIANINTVKDMISVHPNISAEIKTINPKDYGFHDIGHMKFFSSKRKELWHLAIDWFEKQTKLKNKK